MLTFDQFVNTHPTCRVVENSQSARSIYESIIWSEANRIKMAELSDSDIPALVACSEEIEKFCLELPRYKRPKKIIFAEIPRNATGKIEKPKLRKIYGADKLVAMENKA